MRKARPPLRCRRCGRSYPVSTAEAARVESRSRRPADPPAANRPFRATTLSPQRGDRAKTRPMRILLTNDDGVHAQGLKLLESIARELSDDVTIVAPESDQSGVAHSLSLSDPLRLREIGPRHFALKGTPTDCVIMGVYKVF